MEETVTKRNWTKILIPIVIVVLSAVSAFALNFDRVKTSYSWKSESTDIMGMDFLSDHVDFDNESGKYVPFEDDAWIAYPNVNGQYEGVIVTLKQPVSADVPVMIYWSREGEDILSESYTDRAQFDSGERTAFLSLPNYSVCTIRVDLDEAADIESVSVSQGSVSKSYRFDKAFILMYCIKFVLILMVLTLAYLNISEKYRKEGHLVRGLFLNRDTSSGKHLYEYDYIRTLAAILVITEHTVCEAYAPNLGLGDPGYITIKVFLSLSLVCNALYVMLSGALILVPKEESFKDFYIKRLGKVLIPVLCYYFLYVLQGYHTDVFADGIGNGIVTIVKDLLTGRSVYMPHMWLVYAILGLYILAPLIRLGVSKISEKTLFGLVIAGFIFNCFSTYLPIAGITFGIDTPVAGWLGIFLLGYYLTTEHAKKRWKLFILCGIIGIGVTFYMVAFRPELLYYTSNWTPNMWLVGAGVFAFFTHFLGIFGKVNAVIASLAKYNFSIMLIHVMLLIKFVLPMGWNYITTNGHLKLGIVAMILGCFVFSYVIAFVFDNTAVSAANYVYEKLVGKNAKRRN